MIERIETACYRLPLAEPVGDAGHGAIDTEELIVVTVYADGLSGQGYAYTIGRGGRAIQALIEHDLAPLLLGRDAELVEELWQVMWRRLLFVGRGGLASFAIAALDIALWDLRGQRRGLPLYALLGAPRREIPAYGSGVDLLKPLPELLRQVEGFLARGFAGVKVKVGRPDPREDEERIAAVRRLIGEGIDLMVDANMGWTPDEALERARRLAPYRLYWLEEPVAPEDEAGHTRLAAVLDVPIAAGKSLHLPAEFHQYIKAHAVDVVQIDPVTNGGITAALQVLQMANAAGLPVSSHYADELCAHLLCAGARPLYLEKHAFALDRYLVTPQQVVHGYVTPFDVPGHGLRFDRRALAPYRG